MNKAHQKLIELALDRYKMAEEAESEFRRQFDEDIKFTADDQWDPLARQQRTESSRPCFTVDRINPSLRQIVNEEKQNRPQLQVDPTTGGASEQIAKVYAGLIKHIEMDSDAESAYDTSGWYAAAGGRGFIRVKPDYEGEMDFDQKLMIETIADPQSVFFDPNSSKIDGSDAEWAFLVDTISKDEFKRRFPDSEITKNVNEIGGWQNYSATDPEWMNNESIRIAEYFYKDYEKQTLYRVYDKVSTATYNTTDKPPKELLDADQIVIIDTRPTHKLVIKWCLLTSEEVLSESEFKGELLPIVPVYGEMYYTKGKKFITGAVSRAKDAQKILNWTTSNQIETLDMNSKAPWIGAVGQFDSLEDNWKDANKKNFGYLEYNMVDVNGNAAPAPVRNTAEAPINSIMATHQAAADDLKAIFGIFDASLGNQGNETSGIAILARKEQSGVSNYHYYDNLIKSIRQIGRILVGAIPFYYDTARIIRIVKPNGDQEMVAVNQIGKDGKNIDLTLGKYDIVMQTGPSYATKRQEAVTALSTLITAQPQLVSVIGDLAVAEMDWDGAKEAADRIRATIAPEILQASEKDGNADPEQQVSILKVQVNQATQQLKALNALCQKYETEAKQDEEEIKLLKMKSDVTEKKNDQDFHVNLEKIRLAEDQSQMELAVKEEEIKIDREQIAVEWAKLEMEKAVARAGMNKDLHEATNAHIERMNAPDDSTPSQIDSVEGVDKNTLE